MCEINLNKWRTISFASLRVKNVARGDGEMFILKTL
jgi:hypothetical protein